MWLTTNATYPASGNTLGLAGGAIAAGTTLAGLELLRQRLCAGTIRQEDYDAMRRIAVYRAAFEATLADGRVDATDSKGLVTLRHNLRLTVADHDAVARIIARP